MDRIIYTCVESAISFTPSQFCALFHHAVEQMPWLLTSIGNGYGKAPNSNRWMLVSSMETARGSLCPDNQWIGFVGTIFFAETIDFPMTYIGCSMFLQLFPWTNPLIQVNLYTLHYIALHYTALHSMTYHYIKSHWSSHYITWHTHIQTYRH